VNNLFVFMFASGAERVSRKIALSDEILDAEIETHQSWQSSGYMLRGHLIIASLESKLPAISTKFMLSFQTENFTA
jgi:hypothetical protein